MDEVNPRFLAIFIITVIVCIITGLVTWLISHELTTTILAIIAMYFLITLVASIFTNPRSWWDDES